MRKKKIIDKIGTEVTESSLDELKNKITSKLREPSENCNKEQNKLELLGLDD